MGEIEKKLKGISKMLLVLVIAAIIIIAAVVGVYLWLVPEVSKSTISCVASSNVPKGESVAVVGEISPAVADADVTLTFTKPDGSTPNMTVNSDDDGFFTCKYSIDVEGEWHVAARWPGNSEYEKATSTPATFTVSPPLEQGESAISCVTLLPRGVDAGESVTVMGWIYPAEAGATVTLNFTKPGGTSFTESVTSGADGSFSYTYDTTETDVKGSWNVAASWPGTAGLGGATSAPAKFTIFKPDPIKIGVIRNLLLPGQCMEEASMIAADEINDAGGILGQKVVLAFGDEGTEVATGMAEMTRLCTVVDVDFLVGGYRSDIIFPIREVAMDHKKVFIFDSATTELLNCFGVLPGAAVKYPCGECVRCDYDRYKYMFRILPPNSSAVFSLTLIPYIKGYLVREVLGGTRESPVKVAAVIEDLTWTDVLDHVMKNIFKEAFGTTMRLVYYARPSSTETHFEGILTAIRDAGAQIIVHVFSGEAGLAFIRQWKDMEIPALPVGVNVLSQGSEFWADTGGRCEYETHISPPVRVPVTYKMIPFWDRYVERWGRHPVFTALGSYMSMYTLAEAVERAGTTDPDAYPEVDYVLGQRRERGRLIKELEKTDRITIAGRLKFTNYHDIFIPAQYTVDDEGNYHWVDMEYVRPAVVQWQRPENEKIVVYPFNQPYTKELQLPPWMK